MVLCLPLLFHCLFFCTEHNVRVTNPFLCSYSRSHDGPHEDCLRLPGIYVPYDITVVCSSTTVVTVVVSVRCWEGPHSTSKDQSIIVLVTILHHVLV